ncbi:MAG: SpoVG family protein [Phycisphaerae bacterium]|nr:SpoVG family protein [Phycisphaerae bacterium]
MEITEIRVRLVDGGAERLRAFASITLDGDFVIRDLKIIDGVNGYFVAMPSRKLAYRCPKCSHKNHLRARFCNECGAKLSERRPPRDSSGRSKLHVDVAHPINTACRERIQKQVVEAFEAELSKSTQPGYKPVPLDESEEFEGSDYSELVEELKQTVGRRGDSGSRRDRDAPREREAMHEPGPELEEEPPAEAKPATPANDAATSRPAPPPAVPAKPPPRPVEPQPADDADFSSGIFT